MDLSLTTDMELVRAIMTEPEIWERAAEDTVEMEGWYPGYDSMSIWLLCIEKTDIIGVILVHTESAVTLKIHPYLRKEHRDKGRVMMREMYRWILLNGKDKINKINVTIPITYTKVINFVKKMGYKKEGLNRQSYLKNGKLYDQQNLGITRNEIEEYLDEFGSTKT